MCIQSARCGRFACSQALVDNGPHPPPGETGAKFIIREDGRRINLSFMRAGQDKKLELGDKVCSCSWQGTMWLAKAWSVELLAEAGLASALVVDEKTKSQGWWCAHSSGCVTAMCAMGRGALATFMFGAVAFKVRD